MGNLREHFFRKHGTFVRCVIVVVLWNQVRESVGGPQGKCFEARVKLSREDDDLYKYEL